jgi:hypothetical protein
MNIKYKSLIYISGSLLVSMFLFWLFCLNHVGVTDIGVAYNSVNGELRVQDKPGWYVTSPMVRVAHLSTLPMRVTIPSRARVINQRIVRFKAEGAIEFIKLQGFSIWLYTEQENIMMGYAFSGQKYSFLEMLEEPEWTNKPKSP